LQQIHLWNIEIKAKIYFKLQTERSLKLDEVFFSMGGLGILLFAPAYFLLQTGVIGYKTLLLFEGLFFANPHLVSSYLRAYSEDQEIKRYSLYTIYLPIFILVSLSLLVFKFGTAWWILGSLYFYWQWWHHARQSFGLGRKFQKYSGSISEPDKTFNDLAIWTAALAGIVLKSNASHDYYEGIPIRAVHLPNGLTYTLLAVLGSLILFYLARQIQLKLTKGLFQRAFIIHWCVQSFVFICFFGLLPNDIGIIAASFWHCTQYITHVKNHQETKLHNGWLQHPVWKAIYAKENWLTYLIFLFSVSLAIPLFKLQLTSLNLSALLFGVSMTITFHHYLLDAVLWSRKEVSWSLNRDTNNGNALALKVE
jgi:hypothetical protein